MDTIETPYSWLYWGQNIYIWDLEQPNSGGNESVYYPFHLNFEYWDWTVPRNMKDSRSLLSSPFLFRLRTQETISLFIPTDPPVSRKKRDERVQKRPIELVRGGRGKRGGGIDEIHNFTFSVLFPHRTTVSTTESKWRERDNFVCWLEGTLVVDEKPLRPCPLQ